MYFALGVMSEDGARRNRYRSRLCASARYPNTLASLGSNILQAFGNVTYIYIYIFKCVEGSALQGRSSPSPADRGQRSAVAESLTLLSGTHAPTPDPAKQRNFLFDQEFENNRKQYLTIQSKTPHILLYQE